LLYDPRSSLQAASVAFSTWYLSFDLVGDFEPRNACRFRETNLPETGSASLGLNVGQTAFDQRQVF